MVNLIIIWHQRTKKNQDWW